MSRQIPSTLDPNDGAMYVAERKVYPRDVSGVFQRLRTAAVFWLLGILTMFSWMPLVGLVRAEVLRTRNFEYVRAARALGKSNFGILKDHVLPNAMVATLTFLPFLLSGAVTTLTALDFLGFGLPPGSPSLGELLAQGKANLQAPWLGHTGFLTLGLMLTLLIFVGEAVRDALDPRKIVQQLPEVTVGQPA